MCFALNQYCFSRCLVVNWHQAISSHNTGPIKGLIDIHEIESVKRMYFNVSDELEATGVSQKQDGQHKGRKRTLKHQDGQHKRRKGIPKLETSDDGNY